MKDLNLCCFIGRLGQDPKVTDKVARFSIACQDDYKSKSGETVKQTNWINCVTFQSGLISVIQLFTGKGKRVCVSGKMTENKWESEDGQKHTSYQLEIRDLILLDGMKQPSDDDELSDDIPF